MHKPIKHLVLVLNYLVFVPQIQNIIELKGLQLN